MNAIHHPGQNRLLAELQEAQFGRLSPFLELVGMARGDVQTAGHAYRLRVARLREALYRKGPVLRRLLRYPQALMTQMAQAAVCNGRHSTEPRLCRWLLQTLDRTNGSAFLGTQEGRAGILGVRREGVADAAGRLQIIGPIRYRRGHMTVLNRPALERLSCECHGVLRRESLRLLPDLRPRTPAVDRPWRQRGELATRRHGHGERRSAHDGAAGIVAGIVAGDTRTAFPFA